jgi:hypothetical protein
LTYIERSYVQGTHSLKEDRNMLKTRMRLVAATLVAALALTAIGTAPADARYRHRNDAAAFAAFAAVAGTIATIAAARAHRNRYYDPYYYGGPVYYGPPAYVGPRWYGGHRHRHYRHRHWRR